MTSQPEKKSSNPAVMKRESVNGEKEKTKTPYPKAVFFIVGNEFCERYSYYGMRAILYLFLTQKLLYDGKQATTISHLWMAACYFFPIFGAILSDSWLGKYRTIFYISIVHCIGNAVIAVGSIPMSLAMMNTISMIGLVLIAIGTGGIKPCVSAFGGDQFSQDQERELERFFSYFYMSINFGSLIATFIAPICREDVYCFGEKDCYPLAFGVPALLMIMSLVLFVLGKSFYRIVPSEGNVVLEVGSCICYAISNKCKNKNVNKPHWLDHAEDKYDKQFIDDIKIFVHILVLYLPLPIFWSLFDQQASTWIAQAENMDGLVLGYVIKSDQVQILNPILIILFIPLFQYVIYPLFGKCNINRPLMKITIGGLLCGLSFVAAGILELKIETAAPDKHSILLQMPQYFLLTAGEVMFSITGLEFSYSQSPVSMKSVMQGAWLLTVAIGDLLVVVITLISFKRMSSNFFLYAGLMTLDMMVFAILAHFYKYVIIKTVSTESIETISKKYEKSTPGSDSMSKKAKVSEKETDI